MTDNSNMELDDGVEEIELNLDNSMLRELFRIRFSQSEVSLKVVNSYLDEITITPENERDESVAQQLLITAGKIVLSEIVYTAVKAVSSEDENPVS